ncbi:MAG: glycosyltransferase family 2 protein [Deltaproteobacteria bacterium]|nr:glycosyltransferase family 2 protein [Deltaproteobacteria bacterium]
MTTSFGKGNTSTPSREEGRGRSLLVVIPCLNEGQTIGSLIQAIPRSIQGVSRMECLVIDDGSVDRTAQIAEESGATVIRHSRNRGLGFAFESAVKHALRNGYDVMVNIDGDGQFDPRDIPKLIAPVVNREADFVTASRFLDPGNYPKMPRLNFWGNLAMSSLISFLSGQKFYDVSCGFRAYSLEALVTLNLQGQFTYTQETFLNLSFKKLAIKEVPVQVRYLPGRKSRVAQSLGWYGWRALLIIVRSYRDFHPLRFFWCLALAAALLGTCFAFIVLDHYFKTGGFTGQIWAGFVAGSLYFVGIMFFIVGIVTDMLASIRANQERILSLLKETVTKTDQDLGTK